MFNFHQLANLVANEFFNQGDLEKEKFKQEPIVLKKIDYSQIKIFQIFFSNKGFNESKQIR